MLSDRKVPNDLIDSFFLVGGATTSTSTGRDESWYEDESNRIGGASPPAPSTAVQLKWPCNDRPSSRKRRTFNLDELTSSQKDGSGTERNGAKWTSGGSEEDVMFYADDVVWHKGKNAEKEVEKHK